MNAECKQSGNLRVTDKIYPSQVVKSITNVGSTNENETLDRPDIVTQRYPLACQAQEKAIPINWAVSSAYISALCCRFNTNIFAISA